MPDNGMRVEQLGNCMVSGKRENPNQGRVYNPSALSPTLSTMTGGGRMPMVVDINKPHFLGNMYGLHDGYDGSVFDPSAIAKTVIASVGGVSLVPEQTEIIPSERFVGIRQATKGGAIPCVVGGVADLNYPTSKTRRGRVVDDGRTCPTLATTNFPSVLEDWTWECDGILYLIRIRKLTPLECWRLMGFSDEDFRKAEAVNSNTQLYKQAGNSIVKNVLQDIFKQFYEEEEQ